MNLPDYFNNDLSDFNELRVEPPDGYQYLVVRGGFSCWSNYFGFDGQLEFSAVSLGSEHAITYPVVKSEVMQFSYKPVRLMYPVVAPVQNDIKVPPKMILRVRSAGVHRGRGNVRAPRARTRRTRPARIANAVRGDGPAPLAEPPRAGRIWGAR